MADAKKVICRDCDIECEFLEYVDGDISCPEYWYYCPECEMDICVEAEVYNEIR